MADLTATQLSDMRFDLADISSAFTDDELNRVWARADGASDTATQFEAAKGLVIRALLHDAAKFNNYTAGMRREEKEKIFDHYRKLYEDMYASIVDGILGQQQQVVWAALRGYPHQTRTEPDDA